MDNDNLENFLDALDQLRTAKSLLDEIWMEVGPYGREIPDSLRYKIQDFYNFDDSE